MYYKDQGIITKITPYSESDKIVVIYTQNHGKIHAIAKGSRKTKSKMAGRIDLFCQNYFQLAHGKSLEIISQAEIINNFYSLQSDYDKIMIASYIAKIINKYTPREDPSPKLYGLIVETLTLLTTSEKYDRVKKSFQTAFLHHEKLLDETTDFSGDIEFENLLIESLK